MTLDPEFLIAAGPFHNNATVIRGGEGEPTLPDIFEALQQSFHCGNGSATFQQEKQ